MQRIFYLVIALAALGGAMMAYSRGVAASEKREDVIWWSACLLCATLVFLDAAGRL